MITTTIKRCVLQSLSLRCIRLSLSLSLKISAEFGHHCRLTPGSLPSAVLQLKRATNFASNKTIGRGDFSLEAVAEELEMKKEVAAASAVSWWIERPLNRVNSALSIVDGHFGSV